MILSSENFAKLFGTCLVSNCLSPKSVILEFGIYNNLLLLLMVFLVQHLGSNSTKEPPRLFVQATLTQRMVRPDAYVLSLLSIPFQNLAARTYEAPVEASFELRESLAMDVLEEIVKRVTAGGYEFHCEHMHGDNFEGSVREGDMVEPVWAKENGMAFNG